MGRHATPNPPKSTWHVHPQGKHAGPNLGQPPINSLGSHTDIATEIPQLSDHEAVRTTISWGPGDPHPQQRPFHLSSLQPDLFCEILQLETNTLQQPAQTRQQGPVLDQYTNDITQAIANAMEVAMKRALPRHSGHRWWNEEYWEKVATLRDKVRQPNTNPLKGPNRYICDHRREVSATCRDPAAEGSMHS